MKNAFLILVSRFRDPLTTIGQRRKGVRDTVLTCVVFHNILRTHQEGGAHPPNPQDDMASIYEQLLGGATKCQHNPIHVITHTIGFGWVFSMRPIFCMLQFVGKHIQQQI